jgi:hypothetical protein
VDYLDGMGLYRAYDEPNEAGPKPKPEPITGPKPYDTPTPAQSGAGQALEVIADPLKLAEDAFAPDTTKLPLGFAILGFCAVAVLWAHSVRQK